VRQPNRVALEPSRKAQSNALALGSVKATPREIFCSVAGEGGTNKRTGMSFSIGLSEAGPKVKGADSIDQNVIILTRMKGSIC
jgi:hypothetical protein